MITLPAMPAKQTASWLALFDLYDELPQGWTLVGGQLVHLHCAERSHTPERATEDVDAVIDVRSDPDMLHTFTKTLERIGFRADGVSADGVQHRWVRDEATMDVLLPEGIGERASSRRGVTGSPTISTQGGTQALQRTDVVDVTVSGRAGRVRRPNLIGALVVKAAAHSNVGDTDPRRHRRDFLVLTQLIAARDFAQATLSRKDRQRLRSMIAAIEKDGELRLSVASSTSAIERLRIAAGL